MTSGVGEKEDKGMLGNITGQMGGMVDKITGYPDSFKSSAGRRIARIVFSTLMIGLGVGVFFMLNHGNFGALANPSITTLMSMPMTVGITGVGIAWLLEDISGAFGRKAQRAVAKILAIAMPVLLAGGAIAMMAAGFHGGLTGTAINGWFFAGLLILPLSAFALYKGIDVIKNKEANIFIGRAPPDQSHNKEHRSSQVHRRGVRQIDKSSRRSRDFSRQVDNRSRRSKTSFRDRFKKEEKNKPEFLTYSSDLEDLYEL